jgi:uncharacterized protein (DUF952 family)/uncharacterized protein YciI
VRPTYHLVPADTWASRDPAAVYSAPSLADEGFIHCTDGPAAMVATANRIYRDDQRPFVILTLDLDATGSPWRYDDAALLYPHVYGPIAPEAILRSIPIPRLEDGTFLPFELTNSVAAGTLPEGILIERIFIIEATYGPDAEALRPAFRAEHLARIGRLMADGRVIEAGGYLDFSASLLLVRASSEEEAIDLVRDDVYVGSGVWLPEFRARPFGRVVPDARTRTGG